MIKEEVKQRIAREALMMSEASGKTILDGDAVLRIIDEIFAEPKKVHEMSYCTDYDRFIVKELDDGFLIDVSTIDGEFPETVKTREELHKRLKEIGLERGIMSGDVEFFYGEEK